MMRSQRTSKISESSSTTASTRNVRSPGIRLRIWLLATFIILEHTASAIDLPNAENDANSTPHRGICDRQPSRCEFLPTLPTLSFSFGNNGVSSSDPGRFEFWPLLKLWWGAQFVVSSPEDQVQRRNEVLEEVLSVNPNFIGTEYMSSTTTQSGPLSDRFLYTNIEADACANGGHGYQPGSDIDGYFSPRILPGSIPVPDTRLIRGYWPHYLFRQRGWILAQTSYLCRNVIDFRLSDVRNFVTEELIHRTTADAPLLSGIAFDNAAMFRTQYGNPGYGNLLSPYRELSPTEDFISYLDEVRTALHAQGKLLITNGSSDSPLAGHTDGLFLENGLNRSLPSAELQTRLEQYQRLSDSGAIISHRFTAVRDGEAYDADIPALRFFVAVSLLVDRVLMEFEGLDHSSPYFYLRTWLGDPISRYETVAPDLLVRRFSRGVVVLNLSHRAKCLTPSEHRALGLDAYGAPRVIGALDALIHINQCDAATFNPACSSMFQLTNNDILLRGDYNFDGEVSMGDFSAMILALNRPTEYAAQAGECATYANPDLNGDEQVTSYPNSADYNLLYGTVFPGQHPDPRGDLDCDGAVTQFDVDPFVLALIDSRRYQKQFPYCERLLADMDGDRRVTFFDLNAFLERMSN